MGSIAHYHLLCAPPTTKEKRSMRLLIKLTGFDEQQSLEFVRIFAAVLARVARQEARTRDRRIEVFRALVDEWHAQTDHMANPQARFAHRAYQRIIGLGEPALPLVLQELRERPDDWFWALAAISGEDPALGLRGFDEARSAWLDWAEAKKTPQANA